MHRKVEALFTQTMKTGRIHFSSLGDNARGQYDIYGARRLGKLRGLV